MVETINKAIEAIREQTRFIDQYGFAADAESADAAQRKAHTALSELTSLKSQLESAAEGQTARAA